MAPVRNPGERRFNPVWVLATGVLAVSTGAIFVRVAAAPPLVTAAGRLGLATALLLPFALGRSRVEFSALRRGEWALAGLSGGFLALHFATWITSLDFTTVASSVVLVNTQPIWVALLMPWLTRDRMSGRAWLGVAASVAGGVVIGCGDFAVGGRALLGDGLALVGSVAAAIYLLLGRRLRARLSLPAYATVCYGSAAVLLWAVVLGARLPVAGVSFKSWSAIFGMALISQHLGHSSYNWALKFFRPEIIAVSLLGEPVIASLLAWWLFGEALTPGKAAGAALILGGIYLVATAPPGAKRPPAHEVAGREAG